MLGIERGETCINCPADSKFMKCPLANGSGESWPTAAVPVENPRCSCKLTRQPQPYGEPLLQL